MIKNSAMPAMPVPSEVYDKWNDPRGTKKGLTECFGLSKREHFAGLAMQGLLANSLAREELRYVEEGIKVLSEASVEYADALLAELERTK